MKKLLLITLIVPCLSHAATALVQVDTKGVNVNAVEGTITWPKSAKIENVSTGNSVIPFWITPPTIKDGSITFAGVVPGGFTGTKPLFSIEGAFTADDIKQITFQDVHASQNDGKGTETGIRFLITTSDMPTDTDPPESFVPVVGSSPDLFDGAHFLAFSTTDKGSGIDHYEVREGRFGSYVVATSPYKILHQRLDHTLYVKAIDRAGNVRVEEVKAEHVNFMYAIGVLLAILIVALWLRFARLR